MYIIALPANSYPSEEFFFALISWVCLSAHNILVLLAWVTKEGKTESEVVSRLRFLLSPCNP